MLLINIDPGGTVQMIYADDLAAIMYEGTTTVRRASHVEPAEGGGWTADMSPVSGPTLGPFPRRSDALAAEVAWINEHVLNAAA